MGSICLDTLYAVYTGDKPSNVTESSGSVKKCSRGSNRSLLRSRRSRRVRTRNSSIMSESSLSSSEDFVSEESYER